MPDLSWMTFIKILTDFVKTVVKPFVSFLSWLYSKSPVEFRWRKNKPRLGVIADAWRTHVWEFAKSNGRKVIVLHTYWEITNTLPYNLTTFNVYLNKPQRVKGSWMVKNTESQYWGHYVIPNGYTTGLDVSFVIDPKNVKNKKDNISAEIEIVDPLNISHKIKDIPIERLRINVQKPERLEIEDISQLAGVEKKVVSILKNEIEQYKVRGRREGRLGTVDWPRGTMEYRRIDDKIKYLFDDPLKIHVSSESAKALENLYRKSSKNDQELIIKSLLKRIDKKSEYRNVAYLIELTLFEINALELSFSIALKRLQGDKTNGFSDFLRLLDLLLTFRHNEFNEDLLDKVEKFIYSTKEHPFNIKERINAIRTSDLVVKPKAFLVESNV